MGLTTETLIIISNIDLMSDEEEVDLKDYLQDENIEYEEVEE